MNGATVSSGLDVAGVDTDPLVQFRRWYAEAGTDAMAVATASARGAPSVRMVLLKSVDDRGFVFHTNLRSAKAADLADNPRAALLFHWPPLRQVRVTGTVSRVGDDESDAYWRTRPRGSQLGAWASPQSQVVASRAALEERVATLDERFAGGPVPRPPFWGGVRVAPESYEFWLHRDDRLHDRLRYRRTHPAAPWTIERLAP